MYKKIRLVKINGVNFGVARDIEDVAAQVGPYKVYVFEGDTAGPRHPGTVLVKTIKSIMADSVLRKRTGLRVTDFAKLDFGSHPPNDTAINYLIHQKVITKYDMDLGFRSLNIFNEVAIRAVCKVLNKDLNLELVESNFVHLPKEFVNCCFSPIKLQKAEPIGNKPKSLFEV